jgi:hypothetical protein
MRALILVLLATILGCGSKGDVGAGSTTPNAPALAPRARIALADVEATSTEALACNAAGCALACAPNTCVGWRPNASGGCNFACLLMPPK